MRNYKGDTRRIIETYEEMVRLFPNDKEARYRLGSVYYGLKRFDDAIVQFETALQIDNTYKHALNMLGICLFHPRACMKKPWKATGGIRKLVPDEPNPHDSMGEIYQHAGYFDEALGEFKEALRLKSDLHYPWEHMGQAYMDKGEFDKALRTFHTYIELCPSDNLKSYGYAIVGETHWAREEYEEAHKAYREAIETVPGQLLSHFEDQCLV